jgi:hypothetical protein
MDMDVVFSMPFVLIHIGSDLACTHARSEALNGVEVRSWKLEDNRGVIVRCSIRDGARSPVFSFVAVFLPMRYRPCLRVSLNLFLVLSSARRTDRTRFVSLSLSFVVISTYRVTQQKYT